MANKKISEFSEKKALESSDYIAGYDSAAGENRRWNMDNVEQFIGLLDDAGTKISPNGDKLIQINDDGKINADNGTNSIDLSVDESQINHNNLSNSNDVDAHHTKYTDSEAISAINADSDHGSTASHNYFSGSHDSLSNVSSNDHHSRYTDSEAQTAAVNNSITDGNTVTAPSEDAVHSALADKSDTTHNHDSTYLNEASNLSDLDSVSTAKANINLDNVPNTNIAYASTIGLTGLDSYNHNNLQSIDGSTYHLPSTEHSNLTDINAQLGALHTDGSPTFSDIYATEYVEFNETTEPAVPSGSGKLYATEDNGKTHLRFLDDDGLDYVLGHDQIMVVRNDTGTTINKGDMVYISGSTGNTPNIKLAKADADATSPADGVVLADMADGSYGKIAHLKAVRGLDTSAFVEGDELWLSAITAGEVTNTEPTHPNLSQKVGRVTKSNSGDGIIHFNIDHSISHDETGTIKNTFKIGDTTASDKALVFDDGTDRIIKWNNSKGEFNVSEGLSVSGNLNVEAGNDIITDQVRAIDSDGLLLTDDSGNGITVQDGGNVSIPNDLNVGNIYASGEKVQMDTTVTASDNILSVNFGESNSGVTNDYSGIEVDRGSLNPFRFAFEETTTDLFKVGKYYHTLNYSSLSGTFSFNEEVVGSSSGASGYIVSDDGANLVLKTVEGTFSTSESITGQSSGATADVDSFTVTNEMQAVATREDSPTDMNIPYWDGSNSRFSTDSGVSVDSSGNINISNGSISINDSKQIYFRGISDDNWRMGSNIISTGGSLTGNVLQTVIFDSSTDQDQGYQIVDDKAEVLLEVDGANGNVIINKGRLGVQKIDPSYTADIDGNVNISSGNNYKIAGTNLNLQHISAITSDEETQLTNIDSKTISNNQWGYLGSLDQSLSTSDSPEFSGLTVAGGSATGNLLISSDLDNKITFLGGGTDYWSVGGNNDYSNKLHIAPSSNLNDFVIAIYRDGKTTFNNHISINNTKEIRFNGIADDNWRVGRDIITESGNSLTGSTLQTIVYGSASYRDQGYQIVNDTAETLLEVDGKTGDIIVNKGTIGSPDYTAGINGSGWMIDPAKDGNSFMEIDTIRARNEIVGGEVIGCDKRSSSTPDLTTSGFRFWEGDGTSAPDGDLMVTIEDSGGAQLTFKLVDFDGDTSV